MNYKEIFEDCLDEMMQKLNCPICYNCCEDKYDCDDCGVEVCFECVHFMGSDVHDHNLCESCYPKF